MANVKSMYVLGEGWGGVVLPLVPVPLIKTMGYIICDLKLYGNISHLDFHG